MVPDWNALLLDQLDFHWRHQARPRLSGLTDEEYFWEPVRGAWNVRPSETGYGIDFTLPEPEPTPVPTIAWRLGHLIVGVFGSRVAGHFGGPAVDYETFPYAGTASEALQQLDEGYAAWRAGVAGLGSAGLARPCGPAEGPHADEPLAMLVLHISREAIHHLAEIALLRDLWAHRTG